MNLSSWSVASFMYEPFAGAAEPIGQNVVRYVRNGQMEASWSVHHAEALPLSGVHLPVHFAVAFLRLLMACRPGCGVAHHVVAT